MGTINSEWRRRMTLARLGQLLPGMYSFVRRELAYREAIADLAPGTVTADDVVDRAVVAGYQELIAAADEVEVATTVRRLALQQIHEQVMTDGGAYGNGNGKGDEHADPSDAASAVSGGDGTSVGRVFYFFADDLATEDGGARSLLATANSEQQDNSDFRYALEKALAGMPRVWRRAMMLHHVEALGGEALAKAMGRPERDVSNMIDHARAYLREQLLEVRCRARQ